MSILGLVERAYYLFHRRGDIVAKLRPHMPRMGSPLDVLDFGGGTGWVTRALAKVMPGTYTVADIDKSALARAARSPGLRTALLPDEGPLPFPSGSFDCILVVDVLHHLPDARATLKELARCLRPPGRLLFVEFDGRAWLTVICRLLARILRLPRSFWTPEGLQDVLGAIALKTLPHPVDSGRFMIEALAKPTGQPSAQVSAR